MATHYRARRLTGFCGDLSAGIPAVFRTATRSIYQGDYTFTPHLTAQVGFQYENERGSDPKFLSISERRITTIARQCMGISRAGCSTRGRRPGALLALWRSNFSASRASFYALRPRKGAFSGTRLLFNFGDAVREPSRPISSIRSTHFLEQNPGWSGRRFSRCISRRLRRRPHARTKADLSSHSSANIWSSKRASFTTSLDNKSSMSGWI